MHADAEAKHPKGGEATGVDVSDMIAESDSAYLPPAAHKVNSPDTAHACDHENTAAMIKR